MGRGIQKYSSNFYAVKLKFQMGSFRSMHGSWVILDFQRLKQKALSCLANMHDTGCKDTVLTVAGVRLIPLLLRCSCRLLLFLAVLVTATLLKS